MSQYSFEPRCGNRDPYREWEVAAPTTRRVDVWLMTPQQAKSRPALAGKRLALIADRHGDNCVMIATGSMDEYRAIAATPAVKKRAREWTDNRPRYGTWAHYLTDVAFVRDIFEAAGWTPTEEEHALMDALEAYQPIRRVA